MQHTIAQDITIPGIGLHSGACVTLILRPAPADHGIVFIRTDLPPGTNTIPALYNRVVDTRLCTVIGNESGAHVGTIEHLMSALRGCGVDNVVAEINGPEIPVMDGSAAPFVALIDETGIRPQTAPRRAIRVLQPVAVEEGGKLARLTPAEGSVFGGEIEFSHPTIGHQKFQTRLVNGNFRHDIAGARTFGFMHEVEAMRRSGLALGGSLDNAVVLGESGVINEGGLRFGDEFIRHKLLDAIGDLYLAGGPILGAYDGVKAGHAMNNAILHKLFTTPGAWERADLYAEPGEGTAAPKTSAESIATA